MALLACDFCTTYIDTDEADYLDSDGEIRCENCAEHCKECNALAIDSICPSCLPVWECEQSFHYDECCTCGKHIVHPPEPDVGINHNYLERK